MANRLKMAKIHSIQLLHSMHWSQRRIARELGIDRETVRKYLACELEEAKPAIPPPGSDGSKPATFAGVPAPSVQDIDPDGRSGIEGNSKPAIPPTGSELVSDDVENSKPAIPPTDSDVVESTHRAGRLSECERFREVILEMLDRDLSAQRIFQDLVADHGFKATFGYPLTSCVPAELVAVSPSSSREAQRDRVEPLLSEARFSLLLKHEGQQPISPLACT